MNKSVLITGGCGFIGSHLVEYFIKKKFNITVLDKYNIDNNWGHLQKYKNKNNKIRVILGDIRDYDCVFKSVKGNDSVIHLAALGGIPFSYFSPLAYIKTNIEGTYNILEASRNLKTKQVLVFSTSETYGSAQYVPMNEKHPKLAQSPYAASKIAADQIAISYYKSFDTPVKIVRPFNVFGERQSDRAVIPTIISQLLDSSIKKIELGNINTTRDFTYVSDVCEAIYKIFHSKYFFGKEVNIGSNEEISIQDLFNKIVNILKISKKIKIIKYRKRKNTSEVTRLLCDNKLIKKQTNWKPKIGLTKGLKKTALWIKKNQLSYNSKFYNI
jgi:NAD dependent epimerase/dehydratase